MLLATASGSSTISTSDRASLLAKLKAYHGEVTTGDDLLEDLDLPSRALIPPEPLQKKYFDQGRILDTLGALEAIANYVKGMPGRKNLLWLSAAFPVVVGDPQRTASPIPGAAPPVTYRAFGPEIKRTMAALNDANVSVYPIDARGLSIDSHVNINIGTMREIADATGGLAYYNRNDLNRGVRKALDDSREVYVMTYYPKAFTEDGAYHQISVRSTRPGVQLRFRRGYYATAAEVESTTDRLARVLASPLDSSEIGIQASVEPAGDDAGALAVVIHVDPADLSLAHDSDRWTGLAPPAVASNGRSRRALRGPQPDRAGGFASGGLPECAGAGCAAGIEDSSRSSGRRGASCSGRRTGRACGFALGSAAGIHAKG